MNRKIKFTEPKSSNQNLYPGIALELAIRSSLPQDVREWPVGLASSWNDAEEAGAFEEAKTLGEMAAAYLRHQLAFIEQSNARNKAAGE